MAVQFRPHTGPMFVQVVCYYDRLPGVAPFLALGRRYRIFLEASFGADRGINTLKLSPLDEWASILW